MHQSGFKNEENIYQDTVPSSVPALGSSRAESLVGELHGMPMYPITTETDIDITAVLLPSGHIQSHHHAMRTAVSETQPPAFALLPNMSSQDKPRLLLKMQPAKKDTNASSTLPFHFGTQLGSFVMEGNPIEQFREEKQTKKDFILSENGTEKHIQSLGRPEHTICETPEFGFYYSGLNIKAEKNPQDMLLLLQNRTDMTSLQRKCRALMTSEDPKIIECSDLYCSEHDIKPQTYVNSQDQTQKKEETVSHKENQTYTMTEPFLKREECVVFLKELQQLSCKVTTSDSDTKNNILKPQEQAMQIKSLLNSMHGSTHQENHNITKYQLEATHIELNEKPPKDDQGVIHECAVSEETEVEELLSSKNMSDHCEEADVKEDEFIQRNDALNTSAICKKTQDKDNIYGKDHFGMNEHIQFEETQLGQVENVHTKNNILKKRDQLDEMEVGEGSVKDQPIPGLKNIGQKDTHSTYMEPPVELDLDDNIHRNMYTVKKLHGETQVKDTLNRKYLNKSIQFVKNQGAQMENVQRKDHFDISTNDMYNTALVGVDEYISRREHSVIKDNVKYENKGQVEATNLHRTNLHSNKSEIITETQDEQDQNKYTKDNTVDKSDQLEEMEVREDSGKDHPIPWLKDTGQKGTQSTFNERPIEEQNIHGKEHSLNKGDVEDENKGQDEAEDAYRVNHNAIKNEVFEEDQVGEDENRHTKNHTIDKSDPLDEIEDREDSVKDQLIPWLKDTGQMGAHSTLNESPVELVPDVEDKNIHRKEHSVNKREVEDENKDQVEAEDAYRTNNNASKNEVFEEEKVGEDENRHSKNHTIGKSDQFEEMEDRENSVKDQPIPWLKDTGQKGTQTTFNGNPAELDPEVEDDHLDRNEIYTVNKSAICEQTQIKENVYRKEHCKMIKSVQFEEIQMREEQRTDHYEINKNDKALDEEGNNIHRKEHSGNKIDPEDEKNGQDAAENLHRTNHHAIKSAMFTETQGGEEENIHTKDKTIDKSDQLEVGEDSVKDQPIHWLKDIRQKDTHGAFTESPAELDPDTEDDNMKSLEEECTANYGNIFNACRTNLDEFPEVACPTSTQLLVIECGLSNQCTVQSEERPAYKPDNKNEEKATPQVFIKTPTQDTYGKIIREKGLSLLEDLRRNYLDSEGHGFTLLDSGMVLTGDDSQREKNIAFVTLRNGLKLGMAIPISDLFFYYNLGLHFYITEQLNDDWYCVKDRITQEKMLMKKVPVISSWGKSLHNFLFLPYHPRLLVPYAVLYDRNGSIHYLMEYKHVLAIGRPPPGRHFDKEKSFWEVMHFLSYCKKNGLLPPHIQETILHTEQGVCFDPSGLCNSEDPCILKKSIKSVLLLLFCGEQQEHLDRELELLLDRAYQCLEEDTGWPEQLIPENGLSLQRAGAIPFSFPCFLEEN
ncbi:uncharacterized protein LOC108696154 [Xenopus laevis]|uniref:Uncharacterized protein LOC108696154 n=1 Tax=Xenopus laevis TaxID=8355 RepID=A0A8J0T9T2_XENLA|nr:uncharacterized protein LOC108696154 [Xenopus laevis]